MVSEAQLARGNSADATRAADQAFALSKETGVVFWAARAYIRTNQSGKALALAQQLADHWEPDPQAYAKLIEGDVELKAGKPRDAIKLFLESRKIADTWMGRFEAAQAYLIHPPNCWSPHFPPSRRTS